MKYIFCVVLIGLSFGVFADEQCQYYFDNTSRRITIGGVVVGQEVDELKPGFIGCVAAGVADFSDCVLKDKYNTNYFVEYAFVVRIETKDPRRVLFDGVPLFKAGDDLGFVVRRLGGVDKYFKSMNAGENEGFVYIESDHCVFSGDSYYSLYFEFDKNLKLRKIGLVGDVN